MISAVTAGQQTLGATAFGRSVQYYINEPTQWDDGGSTGRGRDPKDPNGRICDRPLLGAYRGTLPEFMPVVASVPSLNIRKRHADLVAQTGLLEGDLDLRGKFEAQKVSDQAASKSHRCRRDPNQRTKAVGC